MSAAALSRMLARSPVRRAAQVGWAAAAFEIVSATKLAETEATAPSSRCVAGEEMWRVSEFEILEEEIIGISIVVLQSRSQELEKLRQG